jgi:hypothetical protein
MNVVTRAIRTIIENSACEITPSSSPMFRTISSVRPRVFNSAPSTDDSCQEYPATRAIPIAASHLPAIATPMIANVSAHSSGRSSRPTSVFRPLTTKKSGRSTIEMNSSSRRETSWPRSARRGITSPVTNAPKIAATPLFIDRKAEISTPAQIAEIQPAGTRPASS